MIRIENINNTLIDKKVEKFEFNKKIFKTRHSQVLIQLISDFIAIVLSYLIFFFIRFESGIYSAQIKPGFIEVFLGAVIFVIFWMVVFFFSALYKNWYERSPFEEMWSVLKVVLIGCAIIVFSVNYYGESSPRQLYFIYVVLLSVSILTGRFIARNIEKKLRKNRILTIPVLLVGTLKRCIEFNEKMNISPSWGFKSLGIILLENEKNGDIIHDYNKSDHKVIGYLDSLEFYIDAMHPEEVLICSDKTNHDILLSVVNICSEKKLRVRIEPDLYDIFTGLTKTQNIYGIPLIDISTQLLKPWQQILKRYFDIVISLIALIGGLPFWLLIALCVKLDSKGPFLYSQPRVGKNGKIFKIYKFRSMRHSPVPKEQNWTVQNDPRVTKFGRFIRKTHIDEIPQFFNVLKGDMSVVGPRPE